MGTRKQPKLRAEITKTVTLQKVAYEQYHQSFVGDEEVCGGHRMDEKSPS